MQRPGARPGDNRGYTMGISTKWVIGALIALVGLVALFLASRAHDDTIYLFGIVMFVFSVLYVFGLIGKYVGRSSEADSHSDEPSA